MDINTIEFIIDNDTLARYDAYYFGTFPSRKKRPINHPYHESINTWMIMKRPAMNALKQRWKDFICWLVAEQGYSNLRIERCDIRQTIYYPTNRRHDADNTVPKFILDGFVDGGLIVDDDFRHIRRITLECQIDKDRPRTEIVISIIEEGEKGNGKEKEKY